MIIKNGEVIQVCCVSLTYRYVLSRLGGLTVLAAFLLLC